jgi:hypothetical protein
MRWISKIIGFTLRWTAKFKRVREVVAEADKLLSHDREISGERKRHQALNRLRVEFPSSPANELALLLEIAVQETK